MEPLQLSDSELYGPIQGHLILNRPLFNPTLTKELGEIAHLIVQDTGGGNTASLYLTKEQAIELRDYLDKLIGETITDA